jgi:hypothetical protein
MELRLKFITKFSYFIYYKVTHMIFWLRLLNKSPEERFTTIYKENIWGDTESISGPGSTMKFTSRLRLELPILIKKYNIKSVLDAPCGDFNWMRSALQDLNVDYTGGDIVKPLIKTLEQSYSSSKIKFVHLDITKDKLPPADLMIVRDCLFHLSNKDINSFLKNFSRSNIGFLLTTSHFNQANFINKDILTGDFRMIDLFSPPFSFPDDPLFRIEDWSPPQARRELVLWSRNQILSLPLNAF